MGGNSAHSFAFGMAPRYNHLTNASTVQDVALCGAVLYFSNTFWAEGSFVCDFLDSHRLTNASTVQDVALCGAVLQQHFRCGISRKVTSLEVSVIRNCGIAFMSSPKLSQIRPHRRRRGAIQLFSSPYPTLACLQSHAHCCHTSSRHFVSPINTPCALDLPCPPV